MQQHALAANARHLCLHGRRAHLIELGRRLRGLFGIELRWEGPREISEVQIIFDTGFARPLTLTHSDGFNSRIVRGPQPETVRDYVVELEVGGNWVEVKRRSDNYQRRRVHHFECLTATALRITCTATNGDAQARLFEVRAYS